ncbi:protrudin isoform X3 [Mobula hypostoma]|uniref:protrudin isoform X3 n=1 Tax=Mobula hypostoma TaxID=723540 RepID=UPI002FC38C0B
MQPSVGPAPNWEAATTEGLDRKDSAGSLTAATCTNSSPLSSGNNSPLSEPEAGPTPETAARHSPTETLDLLSLVVAFKRLEIFAEPLYDFWELLKYLIRWKAPLCSLVCCVTLNVLFLALSQAGWFILLAMVISTPAVLGYLQDCCQEQLTEQALAQRKSHSVRREDLQKVKITRQEALVEIKTFLIHLDDLLNKTCISCEAAYRVLYWEDHTVSVLFYGTLLGILSLLYLLPLCWVLTLLNNAIFLGNANFYHVLSWVIRMHAPHSGFDRLRKSTLTCTPRSGGEHSQQSLQGAVCCWGTGLPEVLLFLWERRKWEFQRCASICKESRVNVPHIEILQKKQPKPPL